MITEKLTTLARPYALAAFEYALSVNDLSGWEGMLKTAGRMLDDKALSRLLAMPAMNKKDEAMLFTDVLAKLLDTEKKNFIYLLAEYDRLTLLPEIARLFAAYRAQHDKLIAIQLVSAVPLDKTYQQKFIDALASRLKQKVALEFDVDPALIGGAVVRIGDRVIDGSIRGKLNRLVEFI